MIIRCFSTSFRYLDYAFGTDVKYRAQRKREAEEKASKALKAE